MIVDGRNGQTQQVIPRWMPYAKALREGELGRSPARKPGPELLPAGLALELESFRRAPHPRIAASLFERLLLLEFREAAKEVAKYVVDCKSIQAPTRQVANNLLSGTETNADGVVGKFQEQIRHLKELLRTNPRNGLRWVELARCYTVLQQYEKADEALRVALGLNPHDRYTARSAVRFLVHVDERIRAANVIKPDPEIIQDPWLLSAGLSAQLLANRSPKKRITLDPRHFSDDRIYDWSEYFSALGMLAIRDGKGSAKTYFKSAWKDPSGNVTTHAEWVSRALFPGLRHEVANFCNATPEARARISYSCGDWATMYARIEEWKLEEPYSRRPYRFHAATENILGRPAEVLDILSNVEKLGGGLDFPMLANKAYAMLCLARLDDAAAVLVNAEPAISSPEEKTVFVANAGLHAILCGDSPQGLELYDRAERLALDVSEDLKAKVFLNKVLAKSWMGLELAEREQDRLRVCRQVYVDMDSILLFKAIDSAAPEPIQKLKLSLPTSRHGGIGNVLREAAARFFGAAKPT